MLIPALILCAVLNAEAQAPGCNGPGASWDENTCTCNCSFGAPEIWGSDFYCPCDPNDPCGFGARRDFKQDCACDLGCPHHAWDFCLNGTEDYHNCQCTCPPNRTLVGWRCECNPCPPNKYIPWNEDDCDACKCISRCDGPVGSSQNPDDCSCICPTNYESIGGGSNPKCQCTSTPCPAGRVRDSYYGCECVCPNESSDGWYCQTGGGSWNSDSCACTCSDGKTWNGSSCVCPDSCGAGYEQAYNCSCVCPPPKIETGGSCIDPPTPTPKGGGQE